MPADAVFVVNEPVFRHVFQSWDGPVGRDIMAKCRALEVRAMAHAGFVTGELVASIDTVFLHDTGGDLLARTGANPAGEDIGYGLWTHNGTRPHPIFPVRAKMLRYPKRAGKKDIPGRWVFRYSVWHPGNSANSYLTRFLREVF